MAANIEEFFDTLEARVDPAKLAGWNASYRFEIDGAGSWAVVVADGRLSVGEAAEGADCVLRMSAETFTRLLDGRQKVMSAYMLGKIGVEGDMGSAMKLRDLFA
jgi:putative sterol carrier protein